MPAHIYARVGRWADAARANVNAIDADRRYRALSPNQDFYNVYMVHNAHFLAWASMMQGRRGAARDAARQVIAKVPPDFAESNAAFMDSFFAIELEVMMRFGEWEEILKQPAPAAHFPVTTAMWRFARGVALAAQDKVKDAQEECDAFRRAVKAVPADAPFGNNKAHDVLAIADHVLRGEIALARGDLEEAARELQAGAQAEDGLRYNESPDWIQPVRHPLGAVLLRARRVDEAERVYREDLKRWPENGWSLYGLAQCLESTGRTQEATRVKERFKAVWSDADISIASSCLCTTRR
jgi:tetratricopeptide (TPR) repeat protein